MSIEAYKIAVKISLVEGVTRGLQLMSRHFKATDADAAKLEARLKSIGKMAAVGTGLMAAGGEVLSLFKQPLEEAAKYQTLVERFRQFGMGDAALQQAEKFVSAQDIMGSSQRDMMRYFVEAQGVFRESGAHSVKEQLAAASMAAPALARINFAMRGLSEESHRLSEAKQMDMLRFVEQAGGLNSPARFNALLNAGFKAVQSSGGNIDFTQYRQFMARGGTAAYGLSDRSLFADLEPIIGEMKGSTAGTALMTAFNRLNGIIKLPNQVAHALVKGGIWDGSNIEWNSQGGIARFVGNKRDRNGNPLIGSRLLGSDPVEFYRQLMQPMYARMHLDEPGILRENSMIFGRTGGAMFNLMEKQMPTILRSRQANAKAHGIESEYEAVSKTYEGRQAALTAKWQTLMLVIGRDGGILDLATKSLGLLGDAVQRMILFARQHPVLTRFSLEGTAALAGLAIVGGALTNVAAAARLLGLAWTAQKFPLLFSGAARLLPLLASGIAALSLPVVATIAALAGLTAAFYAAYQHWDQIKGFFATGASNFHNRMVQIEGWFGGGTPAVPAHAMRSGGGNAQPRVGDVHLDGKKVGRVLWQHVAANMTTAASRPNAGTSSFNPGWSVMRPTTAR